MGSREESRMSRLEELRKVVGQPQCTPEEASKALAQVFGVRSTEIGLLFRDQYFLKFLYPVELQAAGSIPLSGSAVAARTATTKKADIFNNFARVPHRSIFETIKLRDGEAPQKIQKLMSAPIFGGDGEVIGIVQVSRKGDTPREAGPDFTRENLEMLQEAAKTIAVYIAKHYKSGPDQASPKAQGDSGVTLGVSAAAS